MGFETEKSGEIQACY